MILDAQSQSRVDEEHLRVLSVLFFVYGGLMACLSLGALLLLAVGGVIGAGGAGGARGPAGAAWPWGELGAASAGCVFVVVGGGLFLLFGTMAALRIFTGFALRRHRYRTLCLVTAALVSFEVPIGSLLGVATLIVLLRPSVERLFSPPAG